MHIFNILQLPTPETGSSTLLDASRLYNSKTMFSYILCNSSISDSWYLLNFNSADKAARIDASDLVRPHPVNFCSLIYFDILATWLNH